MGHWLARSSERQIDVAERATSGAGDEDIASSAGRRLYKRNVAFRLDTRHITTACARKIRSSRATPVCDHERSGSHLRLVGQR